LKLFGMTIERDREAMIQRRREVLSNPEYLEEVIKRGIPKHLNKTHMWRLSGRGIWYPKYSYRLDVVLYSAIHRFIMCLLHPSECRLDPRIAHVLDADNSRNKGTR